VEGGIERALIDLDDGAGDLLQALRDAVAVGGLEREDLEDQHVERALRDGKTRRGHRYLKLLQLRIPRDRSKIKAWDRQERGFRNDARFHIFDTWREKIAQAA